jgi:hypothetical protein
MWRGAIVLAGGWAAINGLWYAADFERRYRAESAWLIFATVLAVAAVIAITRDREEGPGDTEATSWLASPPGLAVFVIAAAALYLRMLSIGLLSDDFVLLARAQSGALADTQWDYLRPVPLAIWQALSGLRGIIDIPVAVHSINVGLHGLNAWLVLRLATRFGIATQPALLGALLFLAFPAAVETVSWASGVFDVLLTTLALTACIVVTGRGGTSRVIVVALITATVVLTKETGVVLPALLASSAWCAPRVTLRQAAVSIVASASVVLLYFAIRWAAGFASAPPVEDFSGYALKEMVTRPFGTLALPFHSNVLQAQPWIPFVLALFWPALFVFGAVRWSGSGARQIAGLAGWIMISIAPLAGMLFVAPDLQGSRYLYLGSAGWCLMPLVLLRGLESRRQLAIVIPLILLFATTSLAHQSPWIAAAAERDRVLTAFRDSGLNCVPQAAEGLPDHMNGAYVFRNGFTEAIARTLSTASAPCSVVWDGTYFSIFSPR